MEQVKEKIAIIGTGRVGCHLAVALKNAGLDVLAVSDIRSEQAGACAEQCGPPVRYLPLKEFPTTLSMIFIAVPDDYIGDVAASLDELDVVKKNTIVCHTSGAKTSEVLYSLSGKTKLLLSVHPVQTITENIRDWEKLLNIYWGLEGIDDAQERMKKVLGCLNGRVFSLTASQKSGYHAACVWASNFIVAVMDSAIEILMKNNIPEPDARHILAPLALTALQNVIKTGPTQALTGPVVRGDAGTVAGHLDTLKKNNPRLLNQYLELAGQLLVISSRADKDEEKYTSIKRLLEQYKTENI